MLFIVLGGIVILVGLKFYFIDKVRIDFKSIFAATIPLHRDVFGVYCFTGHQGSGKTYALNKWIQENHEGKKIYSNIHSLEGIEYEPIRSIEHLYSLADQKNIIIIYDEIFTLMSKSKRDREMLEQFLPQMRKVKNIFLTTAQYWLELDITFRRFVRIQIECETSIFWERGILYEQYNDTTKIKWDNLENEYVSPRIASKYSKYQKKYMETYDTFEVVKKFSDSIKAGSSGAASRRTAATTLQATKGATSM